MGSIDGSTFIDLPEAYLKDQIPVGKNEIPTERDLQRWKHLKTLKLPSLPGENNMNCIPRVTILIGVNVPAATTPLESKVGNVGEPYALRTPLGWLIYGVHGNASSNNTTTSAHFCKITCMTDIQKMEDRLEDQLKTYINLEFPECLSDPALSPSKEDRQFVELMDREAKVVGGHYQIPLPFRGDVDLPNNKPQAYMYINHLKRRLSKDQELHEQYTEFMTKMENKNYSERVPDDELDEAEGRPIWYIPHHAVKHPQKKSLRVRVVFNCPSKYKGTSLNDQLLQGPDLTNRLLGILLRWRKGDIALMADIEAMFSQVRVPPSQRDLLRYLWWSDGDMTKEPQVYRMKAHVFGAISSPSSANYALRRCALDNSNRYDKQVTEAILHDFYVDDFVKSVEEESTAVKLVKDIKQCLEQGGFNLVKWMSNSREVLKSIPSEDRAKGLKNLDIHHEDLPKERTLGVLWDVESDQIGFNVKEVDPKATRRNMLSVVSQVYDPIGITAPYTLKAKKILQTCCKEKLPWDDPVSEEQHCQWNKWLQELPTLEELRFDRCYKPKNFGTVVNTQLHHFADASKDGYGMVSYLRLVNDKGDIHTSFVTGKARVAPLKPHTIVKMELTAATTSVKVDTLLKKELDMDIDGTTFWTDSQTVLKYIKNKKSRLPVFVANRVAVIQDGSDEEQWKYIPSAMNPADHASRGMKATELTSNKLWLKGPTFLEESEDTWSDYSQPSEAQESDGEEAYEGNNEVTSSAVITTEEDDPLKQVLEYYSDWTRLKRAVAWLLRLKKTLMQKAKHEESPGKSKYLTLEELQLAEEVIIQRVQREAFPDEITTLERNQQINKTSSLCNLSPIMCNGLLRVGGRLHNAPITDEAKHPLILPKHHHVGDLIIRHIHQQCNHQGRNHTLAELRQRYWVINAATAVKKLVKRCIICRRQNARAGNQIMADLAPSRVKAEEPPFSFTGMDYFGPFEIKQGRSCKKRYGVLFTCMTTRAVHLEIAESLDTSSCINAIRRFISRRGPVKEITSDNGTNLVGANNELRQALRELKEEDIQNFATRRNIVWKFNIPAASHHGGVWERQVRTVRKILQAMLTEQHLKSASNEEQLYTLFCEVESTINSRPLTTVSEDPNDLAVITPNHLLHLKSPESFPPGKFVKQDQYARRRWRQVQYLADIFWNRWTKEYLSMLQQRQKWLKPQRNLQEGDIVLIVDSNAPRNSWPVGRVQQVHLDKKGLVRSVTLKTKTSTLMRPVTKTCLLLEQEDY